MLCRYVTYKRCKWSIYISFLYCDVYGTVRAKNCDLQSLADMKQPVFLVKICIYSAAPTHEAGHISGGSLRTSSIMSSTSKLFLWQTLHSLNRASWHTHTHTHARAWQRPTRCTLFLIIYFTKIILDVFRSSICSSSGGVLYKQLTVFRRASWKESSRWHSTNDTGNYYYYYYYYYYY
jgi:hypothetical protein